MDFAKRDEEHEVIGGMAVWRSGWSIPIVNDHRIYLQGTPPQLQLMLVDLDGRSAGSGRACLSSWCVAGMIGNIMGL